MPNEPLTQANSKEEWEVQVGKETFVLSEKEVQVLKQVTMEGSRALVWFGDFAISIPHIQSVTLRRRWVDRPALEAGEEKPYKPSNRILEIKDLLSRHNANKKND